MILLNNFSGSPPLPNFFVTTLPKLGKGGPLPKFRKGGNKNLGMGWGASQTFFQEAPPSQIFGCHPSQIWEGRDPFLEGRGASWKSNDELGDG